MSKKGSEDSVPATWPPDLALPLEMQFKAAVAEVEGDISKSAREPVIDDDIPLDGLKKEWIDFANILLEFIRHNEEIRRAVINVGTMAVQQTMLKELFSGLIDTELWQEYEDDPLFMQLLALASFGEVPEELLVPDIRNAPELVSTTIKAKNIKDATRLKREKYNEGNREIDADGLVFELFSGGVTDISIYQNMLNSFIERMQYNPGVSKDEKKLTALLLHISRTIKLLSAIATLQESGIQVETSSDGLSRLVLKSGITFITARDKINLQGLIESGTDVKLELVSDRSLKLTTGEKTYFIKERKTPKHLIT
ncbi:MAG: hypothetical protein MUF85_02805, partial [Patescibacteria group bacterium]|nr:hypothetical protein [Patescibacteria group bacterium]